MVAWVRKLESLRRAIVCPLILHTGFVLLSGHLVTAEEITIVLDRVELMEGKYKAVADGPFKTKFGDDGLAVDDTDLTHGKFRPKQFEEHTPFNTKGLANGLILANSAKGTIADLHLRLLGDDTFKANSTGGNAFPNAPTISEDKKEISFSGGNLKIGDTVWAVIPKLTDDSYTGMITPQKPPVPPKKEKEGVPRCGNDGSGPGSPPKSYFDPTTGTLALDAGVVNFVALPGGGDSDSIIGSTSRVDPTRLVGPSSEIAGAFVFEDTLVRVETSSVAIQQATITQLLVIPDESLSGFNSLMLGLLVWEESELAFGSEYLSGLYGPGTPGTETAIFFRCNLLSETDDGVHGPFSQPTPAGGSVGRLSLGAVQPTGDSVPAVGRITLTFSALVMLLLGLLSLRGRHHV